MHCMTIVILFENNFKGAIKMIECVKNNKAIARFFISELVSKDLIANLMKITKKRKIKKKKKKKKKGKKKKK